MGFFKSPTSFRLNSYSGGAASILRRDCTDPAFGTIQMTMVGSRGSHPALGHLILLVFEAVMEVVCVSLPGYIVARQGMFDVDKQKFVANLNVALFTPCLSMYLREVHFLLLMNALVFTKLASQLTADKLPELGVIPVIFLIQILVSYLVSIGVSKAFGFAKRPTNFVTAMGVGLSLQESKLFTDNP
jgi:auxin efflux carrier family protein